MRNSDSCVKRTPIFFQLKQHFIDIRMCVYVWGWGLGWLQIQDSISCWVLICRIHQWSGLRYLPIYKNIPSKSHYSLQWRHNGRDSVSNHQPQDCWLNRLFRRRSKKTSKLRVTGLCAGNSPWTAEFPAQMASDSENVSIWWRHHVLNVRPLASLSYRCDLRSLISLVNQDYLSRHGIRSGRLVNLVFTWTHSLHLLYLNKQQVTTYPSSKSMP